MLRVGALFFYAHLMHMTFSRTRSLASPGTAYIVESYPGGIGIASKALERWRNILKVGISVADLCRCHRGCPNCIVPPRSTEDLDKVAGIRLARSLLNATKGPQSYIFANGLWEHAPS